MSLEARLAAAIERIEELERRLRVQSASAPAFVPPPGVEWSLVASSAGIGAAVDATGAAATAAVTGAAAEGYADRIGLVLDLAPGGRRIVVWQGEITVSASGWTAGETYHLTATAGVLAPDVSAVTGRRRRAVVTCLSVAGGIARLYVLGRANPSFDGLADVDPDEPSGAANIGGLMRDAITREIHTVNRQFLLKDLFVSTSAAAVTYPDHQTWVNPDAGGSPNYAFTGAAGDNGKVLTWVTNADTGMGGWVAKTLDVTEAAQDAVAAALTATATITWTYNDASNQISANVTAQVVQTTSSYADPAWITSMAWSKITGRPTTLAGYGITDGVSTGGSYANPAWITSLAWSKLTGTPTTLAGYGITDAQPLDTDLTALAGIITTGFLVRTGAGTATTRSLTAGTNIAITNADGVAAAPSIGITGTIATANGGTGTSTPAMTTTVDATDTTAASPGLSVAGTFGNPTFTLFEKRPKYNAKWLQGIEVDTATPTTNGDILVWNSTASKAQWNRGLTTRGDILIGTPAAQYGRLGIGAAGTVLSSDGTDPSWQAALTYLQLSSLTRLTSGTSLSVPAGSKWMVAALVAGGGGGGGGGTYTLLGTLTGGATATLYAYTPGGGGGAGGILIMIASVAGLSSVTYAIGAGGAGGAASTAGSAGGDTTLTIGTDLYTAKGGPGGPAQSSSPAAGSLNTVSGTRSGMVLYSRRGYYRHDLSLGAVVERSTVAPLGGYAGEYARDVGLPGVFGSSGGDGGSSGSSGGTGSTGDAGSLFYAFWS